MRWPDVLSQFNTLIARYEALLDELQNPVLQRMLIHPKSVPKEDPDFIPRVWLRTKLVPEILDQEEKLRKEILGAGTMAELVTGRNHKALDYQDEAHTRVVLKTWEVNEREV
ncbi:hypothetical protein HK098_000879 [Nowakowskiella sp. JEL0407]|nr:hypothetical protein HK098_000879 [Nowakowskiella sp. JEL0407]